MHTGCLYCGIGGHCPRAAAADRMLNEEMKSEILEKHNEYRESARKGKAKEEECIPTLQSVLWLL